MNVTVHEVATQLGLSTDTIRRWEKKGLIKASRSNLNYRVFDIDEVKRIQSKYKGKGGKSNYKVLKDEHKNEFTVVDLFSGAGGTSLGLENAGFEHIMQVEIDKFASETLRINRPQWNVVEKDVSLVDFRGIKADVVEGGFPCQAFSYAGKKMGFEDTRGTLFFEFARAVKEIKPKVAVGENVKGLLRHDGGKTLKTMLNTLEEIGYRAAYRVLRSQYLDVPQKRERLIIIAVRKDLDYPILFPKEKNYIVTLNDALQNVRKSEGQKYPPRKAEIMKMVPPGGYWRDLPVEMQKEYMGASYFHSGGKTGMARRLSWDEPSLTLTTSPAQKQTERCHPEETRPLTVSEYARIQTFPDDWKFFGSVNQKYKQIGNAVPVNLGYHIGKAVEAMLQGNVNVTDFEIVDTVTSNTELTLFS